MELYCKKNPNAGNVNLLRGNVNLGCENVNRSCGNINLEGESSTTDDRIQCENCYKSFSSSRTLDAHKAVCQKISHPCQCPKCMKVMSCASSKSRHMKVCEGIPAATGNTQIMNQQNANIINNNNTTNTNSHNTYHVHINNFGQERLDHITPELLTTCFKLINGTGVARLVGQIHCNSSVPDNQNIRIDSIKGKTLMVRENNQWTIKDVEEVVNLLISNGCSMLYNHYDSTPELKQEDRDQNNGMLLQNLCSVNNKLPKHYHTTKRRILASMKNLPKPSQTESD